MRGSPVHYTNTHCFVGSAANDFACFSLKVKIKNVTIYTNTHTICSHSLDNGHEYFRYTEMDL